MIRQAVCARPLADYRRVYAGASGHRRTRGATIVAIAGALRCYRTTTGRDHLHSKQASQARASAAQRKHKALTQFSDSAIEELHRLHRRYATYSALPAQPLRLMQSILERSPAGTIVQAADVARAFAKQTGLPRFLVDDSITVDLDKIRTRLTTHVIGQSEPIELVVN